MPHGKGAHSDPWKTLKPFLMPSHMQSRHYGIMDLDFKFKVALERESKSPFEAELYESRTVCARPQVRGSHPPTLPGAGQWSQGGTQGPPASGSGQILIEQMLKPAVNRQPGYRWGDSQNSQNFALGFFEISNSLYLFSTSLGSATPQKHTRQDIFDWYSLRSWA